MGGYETGTPVSVKPLVGYHPFCGGILTGGHKLVTGHCQAGSLTGAVDSQTVTESPKGSLGADGNRALECKGIRELNCETYRSSRYESRA